MSKIPKYAAVVFPAKSHLPKNALPNPFPAKDDSIRDTREFWLFYCEVTDKIRATYKNTNKKAECEFLEFLIGEFYEEYKCWDPAYKGPFDRERQKYFDLFTRVPRSLRSMSHAYFHMGFDLPRVIARYLAQPPLPLNPPDASLTYVRLNPLFSDILEHSRKSREKNGIYGVIANVLPLKSLSRIPGHWIIGMRLAAWIYGSALTHMNLNQQTNFENRLIDEMTKVAKQVVKDHTWNPIFWLNRFFPSVVLLAVPFAPGLRAQLTAHPILAAVGVAFFLLTYCFAAYRGLIKALNDLGEGLLSALFDLSNEGQRTIR